MLLRDVAYGQVPRRSRGKHRRAAEWIEALGRPDDHAEMLAHHYGQALELARAAGVEDDPSLVKRARESLRDAGERAMSLSAYASAADFFAAALVLSPRNDPDRPRLLLGHGRALLPDRRRWSGQLTEALEAFRAARATSNEQRRRRRWRRAFLGSVVTARQLTATLESPSTSWLTGQVLVRRREALTNQSGFHMLAGRYDDSIRVGGQALSLVEELGMDEQRARLHIVIGTARWGLGDREGLHEVETGISIARRRRAGSGPSRV